MRPTHRQTRIPWQRGTSRSAGSAPPPPRAWKPSDPSERQNRHPTQPTENAPGTPKRRSLIHRLFSLRGGAPQPTPFENEPKDIARGQAATLRVITEGVLDPRYRPAARRLTAIICALPIAIYLSYELFQRRFMGKEQKKFTPKKVEGAEENGEGAK